MRTKAILLVPLVVVPALLQAQESVTVNFPSEGPRLVYASSGWPTGLSSTAEIKTDKVITLSSASTKPTDYVVVMDRDTNNVAVRQVKDLKGAWTVQPQDYRYLGIVTVRVEHEGKPIAAAAVDAESKGKKQSQIVDPSSKGEAKFFALDPGEIKVQVAYKVGQKSMSTRQGFEVALARQRVDPVLVVSVPDDVATSTGAAATTLPAVEASSNGTGTPAADTSKPKDDAKTGETKEAPRGGLGTGVAMLLGLAGAIGGGYVLLQWINQNPGKLKQLGVQVPDPADIPDGAQPGAPVPLQPAAPEPIQQILLGDAAPTPLGVSTTAVAAVAPLAAPAQVGPPRLVGDAGRTLELTDGELFVGRDNGLALSLVGESTVSRRHASIHVQAGRATVKDLGSTNGTFVNGARLQGDVLLQVGDVVQFGSVRFRYEA